MHGLTKSQANSDGSSAQIEAILDSSYDGIYILDEKGIFLKVNSGLERITGLKREELLGKTTQELLKKEIIDRSVTSIVFERHERVTILQRIRSDNKIKEVMVTSTPILDKKGNIQYVVANLRDMTELNCLKYECDKARQLSSQYYSELKKEKNQKGKAIAESLEMRRVLEFAFRVSQVDSTVLIEGESGVGKEVIAHFIHEMSPRREGPFISINCAAVPETLLEAELFGYEAGAFTSAKREGKIGLIELADKGTLFLDEIDSFPLSLQGKLLRTIETLEISKLGSTKIKKVNIRLLVATNKSLKDLVEKGFFRNDLYFRLNVVPISIPPLRDRKKDIIPLIIYFLQFFNEKYNKQMEISPETLKYLEGYHWPGNVRELKNIVERLVVMTTNSLISPDNLPSEITQANTNEEFKIILHEIIPLKHFLNEAEKLLIHKAMAKYGTTRAIAKALKISQASVVRKILQLKSDKENS